MNFSLIERFAAVAEKIQCYTPQPITFCPRFLLPPPLAEEFKDHPAEEIFVLGGEEESFRGQTLQVSPRLSVLKQAPDYIVVETGEEDGWYDGPDGPFTKTITVRVHAYGREWVEAGEHWINRGHGIRERYFRPVVSS